MHNRNSIFSTLMSSLGSVSRALAMACLTFVALGASAQIEDPVTWKFGLSLIHI